MITVRITDLFLLKIRLDESAYITRGGEGMIHMLYIRNIIGEELKERAAMNFDDCSECMRNFSGNRRQRGIN